jgi:4-amino-4-deoxy-L-arabinose transferase-like glycosyltransferase
VPFTLGGDEAWHGLLARQVLEGNIQNPFSMGYMSMPTFFYWPLSWSLGLAGNDVAGLRLPAALVGTVTVPLLYLFARDLWGRRTALLATALLATYDYHIHYSRLGANNVWDPLFVLLALWALDRGMVTATSEHADSQAKAYRSFLAVGLVLGLSIYFYTGARLLPLLIILYTGFVWLKRRRQAGLLGQRLILLLGLAALAFLVVAGPMLSYALSHPNEWNARLNQVGIIQSGWLEREPELTGKSTPQILAEQFLRAAGAFHVFPDRTAWYGAERPLLGWLSGLFGLLGMVWSVVHWRDRRYFLVLIWFWSVIVTGGMLTESPPSSQRLVIAIPAVALLVAFGLEQSVRLVRRLAQARREWENVALGLLVLLLAVGSVRFYFVEFSPTRRYGSENGETATMIGHYLRDLDGGYEAYFVGAPRIYWKFGTMQFLAPDVPGRDIAEPLTTPPDLELEGNTAFVFLPEREAELVWVKQAFPGGQRQDFDDAGGRLRFVVYRVGP